MRSMKYVNSLAVVQGAHADTLAVVQGTGSGTSNANIVIIVIVIIIVVLIAATLFGHKK